MKIIIGQNPSKPVSMAVPDRLHMNMCICRVMFKVQYYSIPIHSICTLYIICTPIMYNARVGNGRGHYTINVEISQNIE